MQARTASPALSVPGARLCYERRGSGRRLLLIGSPMDSTGFAGLASTLADRYGRHCIACDGGVF